MIAITCFFITLQCLLGCVSYAEQLFDITTIRHDYSNGLFEWEQVYVKPSPLFAERTLNLSVDPRSGVNISKITDYKVFVSLATISIRIHRVNNSIFTILDGVLVPTHIFLFISKDAYLLDRGIPLDKIPNDLLNLVHQQLLTIVYTNNIGPHRKLLPLLSRFYCEARPGPTTIVNSINNCNDGTSAVDRVLIVTIDDDMVYHPRSPLLYRLMSIFIDHNETSVTALRVRRIGLCEPVEDRSGMINNVTTAGSGSNFVPYTSYHHWALYGGAGINDD